MSPSFTLKTLIAKVDSKVDKVKSKVHKVKRRMHKTKAAADETENIPLPKLNEDKVEETTVATSEPKKNGGVVQENIITSAPNNNNGDAQENIITSEPETNGNMAENIIISEPETNGKAQEIIINSEPNKNGSETQENAITSEPNTNGDEAKVSNATSEPETNGDEGHQPVQRTSCDSKNKYEKAAKRQARRDARKAKWAAVRAKAKKIGEAMFLPVAMVVGIIFSPLILAVNVVVCIFKGVVWLVVKIVDLVCCGPVLVCFACKCR